MIPVTIVIYYFLMVASISAGRVPGILPVILIVLLLLILILAAWKNSLSSRFRRLERLSDQLGNGVLILFAAGMILPFTFGNRIPIILVPETLALLLLLVYLFRYFNKFDTISNLNRKSLWGCSSIILIIMWIGGSFNGTIPSDMAAIIICVILILLGYSKVMVIKDK